MRKLKNSESRVARVEPINWSSGNNGYAKNCNAGIKRLKERWPYFKGPFRGYTVYGLIALGAEADI